MEPAVPLEGPCLGLSQDMTVRPGRLAEATVLPGHDERVLARAGATSSVARLVYEYRCEPSGRREQGGLTDVRRGAGQGASETQ